MKLSRKVKLLIAVPLIFELAFVAILVHTLKQIETEYAREALARQVSYSTNAILKSLLDASAAYGMYQIDKDRRFMTQFSDAVTGLKKEKQRLNELVASNHPAELVAFDKVTDDVVASLDNALQLLQTGDRVDLVRSLIRVRRLLKEVNQAGSGVIDQQMVLDEYHRKTSAHIRENIEITIIAGVILSVILAAALTFYYDVSTQRRFNVLLENTKLLSSEKPLGPELDGKDELAELDKSFHYMVEVVSEARRKEQALSENAADVICSLDREGRFTKVNSACEQVWGFKPAELLGISIFSIIEKETIETARSAILDTIANASPKQVEIRIQCKDSSIRDTSWSLRWYELERSLFCVSHDISDMKRIERLKQEIVNMVSHDLRSPLTSFSVMLELFEMGTLGSLNEHGERKVKDAREEIARMVSIVNDLLDIEKFESGAFELDCKPESIESIVLSAVSAMVSKAEKRGISIERVDCLGTVFCDKPRIVRVLVNLLDNAIKFSPASSRILVSARQLDNATEIKVADSGRGIAVDKLQMIFERFRQSERLDEIEKAGSGLGLVICKAIVESHKGTISLKSAVDRGSEFSIVLPFQ